MDRFEDLKIKNDKVTFYDHQGPETVLRECDEKELQVFMNDVDRKASVMEHYLWDNGHHLFIDKKTKEWRVD